MNLLKKIILAFLFFLIFSNKLYAADIDDDTTYSSDSSDTQYIFTVDDKSAVITNNSTFTRSRKLFILDDAERTGVSLTIHSGSTVTTTTNSNTIFTDGADLTITNSGTINANTSKAINVSGSDGVSITNNSGGVISSDGNTILGDAGNGADNTTIQNTGKIFSTESDSESSAIVFANNDTGTTITNNAGGEIYSKGSTSTIILGVSSTLTNSGSIKNNKSVDTNVIQLKGNNNTVTLKDGGIVVGMIKAKSGTTGNTLKINHGVGSNYYYDTSGTFTLEDLDGNQVVKGSAGSVGQGGSEVLDELLGTKSLNIRQSFSKYKNAEEDLKDNESWGEINFSTFKRKQNNQNLSLGFNSADLTINLMYPDHGKDFILSLGNGNQKFTKDHDINRHSLHTGFFFRDHPILNKFGDESFILGGVNLKKSEREILTNTTSSGKLSITDNFETFDLIIGTKINNDFIIPNIGATLGLSYTPSHNESHFYQWDNKKVSNLSIYLDDDYKLNLGKNYQLNLGWILDVRQMVLGKEQDYEINGTSASYSQDTDLTKEVTLATNLGFDKKISDQHFFKFYLDSTISTQELVSFTGNFAYKFAF
jgi:hypothetical protein|tara:strand:+ start:164 stop:1942 length:1779 start_codon:yes stop_codon:yes gene_type:complete